MIDAIKLKIASLNEIVLNHKDFLGEGSFAKVYRY